MIQYNDTMTVDQLRDALGQCDRAEREIRFERDVPDTAVVDAVTQHRLDGVDFMRSEIRALIEKAEARSTDELRALADQA